MEEALKGTHRGHVWWQELEHGGPHGLILQQRLLRQDRLHGGHTNSNTHYVMVSAAATKSCCLQLGAQPCHALEDA